jgi:hypothetical protein
MDANVGTRTMHWDVALTDVLPRDMGNRSAKNAGREGGLAPLTVEESAG